MTSAARSPRDQFLDAAFWYGSLDEAQRILADHPELAAADIHTAAALGDDVAVRRFLADDPSSVKRKSGPRAVEPLITLCFSRYLAHDPARSDAFVRAARALLEAGADPNGAFFDSAHTPKPERESALYGAAGVAFHAGVTRLLLEHGAEPNDAEVPYHSPESYDEAAFTVLLESGRMTPDSLATMLLRKADWHDYDGVKLALDHGAPVNAMTMWGKTALHQSIQRDNDLRIIDLMLDSGADPMIIGGSPPRTGVSLAARRGRGDVLASLQRRGTAVDLSGADQLIAACARNDAKAVGIIAAREPDLVRAVLDEGGQLLAEFAGANNAAGVGLLITLGVRVDSVYSGDAYFDIAANSTALHVAAWRASHDAVDELIAKGADVNARDDKARTPLMLAVRACVDSYWKRRRSPRSVKALLSAGASIEGVPYPSGYDEVDALLAERITASSS